MLCTGPPIGRKEGYRKKVLHSYILYVEGKGAAQMATRRKSNVIVARSKCRQHSIDLAAWDLSPRCLYETS